MGFLPEGSESGKKKKKPSGLGPTAWCCDIPILQSSGKMEIFNENLKLSKEQKLADTQFCC